MSVVEISDWPVEDKARIVDWVFDHPHDFTREDVVWAGEKFGIDEKACRQMFMDMPRLCMIERDGAPMYLFGKDKDGKLSTASAVGLEGAYWTLTKSLMRFRRTPQGDSFCRDALGFAEDSDLRNGTVRGRWVEALGFRPAYAVEFQGDVYHVCIYGGPA